MSPVSEILAECNRLLTIAEGIDSSIELVYIEKELKISMNKLIAASRGEEYYEPYVAELKLECINNVIELERVLAQFDLGLKTRSITRFDVRLTKCQLDRRIRDIRNKGVEYLSRTIELLAVRERMLKIVEKVNNVVFELTQDENEFLMTVKGLLRN